ncbi:anti-sigma regulatory factor (Ser/Thr protein kinase) [Streptomyces sp. LBL]|uniref:ATP-binding protein n=1 Tax=Streptomyces sp. LBL TaxID=2940562 RepID=UPI0024746D43|nr:ATP-binding protein [Streptomyces sp. LBL]MDH6627175.1 anti-sigma regulatory factor (Ser/Thr protein kinase) [Streptomyces sp. LBL]
MFTQRLSPTPRGARLARHLALNQLHAWGVPYGSDPSDAVAVIVAELAANAVTHGRVPGRDFELRLTLVTGSVRVEVTDTRTEPPRPPVAGDLRTPRPLDEAGRGLLLVDALADRWEVADREPPPGKTVRAEVDLPGWLSLAKGTAQGGEGYQRPGSGAPEVLVRPESGGRWTGVREHGSAMGS